MTSYRRDIIKTTGKLFLKLEINGKDGSGRRLLLVLFSYLLPGVLLPFFLFRQNADSTGYSYSFLAFLFFSFIVAFTIVSEFDNILITGTEAELFSTMPVEDNLLVGAKMYVILRYIFLTTLPLLVPGSIFFYFIAHSIPRSILFYISGLTMCLFIVYFLLLLYSMATVMLKSSRLGMFTFLFQTSIIFILIISYQFVSYSFTGRGNVSPGFYFNLVDNETLRNYLPPGWFGFIPARHKYIPDPNFISKIFLPFFIVLMSYYSLKIFLTEYYAVIRDKYSSSRVISQEAKIKNSSIRTSFSGLIHKIYLRNYSEGSSFTLMESMYKRDKTVRISIFPMIIIPAGLALFALMTNQLPSPFRNNIFAVKPVFHISILLTTLVVLNTGMLGVKVSPMPEASWIYDAYPVGSGKRFINGIRKFFVVYLLIPVCIILFILFFVTMPFLNALVHVLYIFACVNLYNSVAHLFTKTLPFTRNNSLVNSVRRLASLVLPMMFGILCILLQSVVYREMIDAAIAVIALLTVTYWVNYFGFHRN